MFPSKALSTLLPALVLLGVSGSIVEVSAANTTLTVNCTFTITADVTISWTGGTTVLPSVPTTTTQLWAIGAAAIGGTYGSNLVWTVAQPIEIINSSATGNGVSIGFDTASPPAGWSEGASAASNTYVAAAALSASALTGAAVIGTSGSVAPQASWTTLTSGSTSIPIWLGLTLPTAITTGAGAGMSIQFVFTGTAM